MKNTPKSSILVSLVCLALIGGTFGSYKFATAITKLKTAPPVVLALPKAIGDWKTFESTDDTTKPDVIARSYVGKDNNFVDVVVRE